MTCTSCGAVGTDPASNLPPTVTVTPNSAQPFQGGTVQFHAVVENSSSSAVNWQVNQVTSGNANVGTITSSGFYTAPASVPNPATVMVTAVLQSDPTRTGASNVTIQALSSIQGPLTLSPKLSSVTISQTLQLNVLTAGVGNSDVTWAVDGIANGSAAGGMISTAGDYSPPTTAGSHLITAILKANPSAIGSATVAVTTFPGTLTWRNDNSRSGVNSQELALAPETVDASTFGKLFSCPIDGYAYAQPLYVPNLAIPGNGMHNVVFVATEKDSVYAFDTDNSLCTQLWKTHLVPSGEQVIDVPSLQIPNTLIGPFLGITGTPVIDGNSFAPCLYIVAATLDPPPPNSPLNTPPSYLHRLYALDLATGTIIQASPSFDSLNSKFRPAVELQRSALLLDNGSVYVAFGANGTPTEYHGWLFGYDASSLQLPNGVFNVTPLGQFGGIWQGGGGPSADSAHNLFVATGDGPPNQGVSFSDSFLRLGTNGGLPVADYFTPCDQGLNWGVSPSALLQSMSSAPVLLPDSAGSAARPHLLIGGSKNGALYVVNRDIMGGFDGMCLSDIFPRTQVIPLGAGAILSTPLFWNDTVYVAPGNGNLVSFPMSEGILASSPSTIHSPEPLGPQGATPVISSNGTSNAILWLIDTSGALATPNTAAILRAYDPNNLSNEIYSSATNSSRDHAGPAVKFTVPTVANGKVYVGTQTELDVYGLLR